MSFRYDQAFARLTVTVQSVQWVKIPSHYHGYISLRIVPESKRDPKRKTGAVPLTDVSSGVSTTTQVYGGNNSVHFLCIWNRTQCI